jgi:hypothetical protein
MRYVEKYSTAGQAPDKNTAPVQPGPGVHPASYTMGTGSCLGVKRPGRGVDQVLPSSPEVIERVEVYTYFPSDPS